MAERNDMLELYKKRWEEKMSTRTEKEEEYMNARLKRVEEYEMQLQHLRIQDAEEYNMVKIRLETDVQVHILGGNWEIGYNSLALNSYRAHITSLQ